MKQGADQGQYIIEFVSIGNAVKVSAIDPETLREVSIVGPKTASKVELQYTAIRKLQYVLNKEKIADKEVSPPNVGSKRGIIV